MTTLDDAPTDDVPTDDVPTLQNEDLVDLLDQPERPPLLARLANSDARELVAAVAIGASPALLLHEILGWRGYLGTGIWWYLGFLLTYYLLQRSAASAEVGIDRVITVVVWSIGAAVLAVLTWMLAFVVIKGLPKLDLTFLTQDLSKAGPLDPNGGVKAALIGSAEQVGLAVIVVVPLAVLTAVYLNEVRGRISGLVRLVVNALAGLPSVVAGLIVYSVWVANGGGFSGAAGSVALIILMLPTVTRTSEEVLRIVPDPLREASLALGAPQWRVVSKVVLPTALSGLTTAVILGVALGVGETAPLLLTTSNASSTNTNPFHGPQASLTLFIKTGIQQANTVEHQRAYTAGLVLLLFIGVLFAVARYTAGRSARKLGRRS